MKAFRLILRDAGRDDCRRVLEFLWTYDYLCRWRPPIKELPGIDIIVTDEDVWAFTQAVEFIRGHMWLAADLVEIEDRYAATSPKSKTC